MCDPTLPIDELKELRFSISALSRIGHQKGSYDREISIMAGRGIEARINWIIRQLEAAGEGKKNMGA